MFDLSSLMEKTDVVKVPVKNPITGEELVDNKGNKVLAHMYGRASKRVRDYINAEVNKKIKEQSISKLKTDEITVESLDEEKIKTLVVAVEKIENIELNGKQFDNETNLEELFRNPSFKWLVEQLNSALNDQANFF